MEIWVHRNGQYAGRFSESAIREKVADGSLSATDLAWDEAKAAWKPISELLAAFPVAKAEAAAPYVSSASNSLVPEAKSELPSDAAHQPSPSFGVASRAAATEEGKIAGETPAATAKPPPLPTVTIPSAGPPPLPKVFPVATPIAQPAVHQPPEGETIWSPVMAIIGSLFLSPAFGGFIIWRNWLIMKRGRRALMAAA